MKWRLTEQAWELLRDIERALNLPNDCTAFHKWLMESIEEFKSSNSTINDYEKEVGRILQVLGKFSEVKESGNQETSDIFYELYSRLINIFQQNKFIER